MTHVPGRTPREAVLAHPDLAERLTRQPIGYVRPDQWNGYVPPEAFPDKVPNDSIRRAALVAIVDEALSRDSERKAS